MDVRLPDGRIVRGIPEGTTKQEIARKLRDAGQIDLNTHAEMLGVPTQSPGRAEMDAEYDPLRRFQINVGRGFIDTGEGMSQLALDAAAFLGIPGAAQKRDQFEAGANEERQLFERGTVDDGAAAVTGRIAGNLLAAGGAAALPVRGAAAIPGLTRMVQAAGATTKGRLALGGAAGGLGGATEFAEEGESRLANAGIGAATGAAAGEGLFRLAKGIDSLRQRMPGNRQRLFRAVMDELPADVPAAQRTAIARDVSEGLTLEQALRKADMEQIPGARVTAGRVTGDLDRLNFESDQLRNPGPIAEADQQTRRAIFGEADRLVAAQGGRLADPYDIGQEVTGALERGRKRGQRRVSAAYKAGDLRAADVGAVVQPTSMERVIAENIDAFSEEEMGPAVRILLRNNVLRRSPTDRSLLEVVPGQSLRPETVEAVRRSINQATPRGPAKVVLGRVKEALDDDVVRSVGEDVYANARRIAKGEFDLFTNRQKVKAILDGTIRPDDIVQRINSKSFGVEDVQDVFGTLEKMNPQAASDLRGGVLDSLMAPLRGASDRGGVPEVNFRSFQRGMERFGKAKMQAIYGEGSANSIYRFSQAVNQLTSTDKGVRNPGTAGTLVRLLRTTGQLGARVGENVPVLSMLVGARRAIRDANLAASVERRAIEALDLQILARQQLAARFAGEAGGATAAAGGFAATTGQTP